MRFRWIDWNRDHIARHGVAPEEAELVVRRAKRPYPRPIHDNKWIVRGQGSGGRFMQVIFVFDDDDTAFIIHARPLTDREKRQYRRNNT